MAEQSITKRCCTCKQFKPTTDFYKCKSRKDGYRPECSVCAKLKAKRFRDSEKGQNYILKYRRLEKTRKNQREYNKTTHGRTICRKAHKKYYDKNIEKIRAKNAVANEVRSGRIPKANTLLCSICKIEAEEYHHPNYEKEHWLNVIPVCKICHNNIHNNYRPVTSNETTIARTVKG